MCVCVCRVCAISLSPLQAAGQGRVRFSGSDADSCGPTASSSPSTADIPPVQRHPTTLARNNSPTGRVSTATITMPYRASYNLPLKRCPQFKKYPHTPSSLCTHLFYVSVLLMCDFGIDQLYLNTDVGENEYFYILCRIACMVCFDYC